MATSVKMIMRSFASTKFGMFSTLRCGDIKLYILEPDWKDNAQNESCIPSGIYDVVRKPNEHGHDKWVLIDVNGRTGIEIHAGNILRDTTGCLIVGEDLGCVSDQWAVLHSQDGLEALNEIMEGLDNFKLYITRQDVGLDDYNQVRR